MKAKATEVHLRKEGKVPQASLRAPNTVVSIPCEQEQGDLFSTILSLFFLLVFLFSSLPSSFLVVFYVEPRVSAKCCIPTQHYLNLFSFISVFSTEMEAGPQACQESALPPSAILSSNLGFSNAGSKNMVLKLEICIRIINKWFTVCVHVHMYV